MDFSNATPVAANLWVSRLPERPFRIGAVTAKATFRITPQGAVLDTQEPFPLLHADRETPLGVLPRDDLPSRGPALEVIVLGAAYPRTAKPAREARVALALGAERRELAVFGDRVWERGAGEPRISLAEPFDRMPLTWDRAFGGTAEVLVDADSPIDLADPNNPAGRGFDPGPSAALLCKTWRAPAGYPVLDANRRLPNLEDPAALVRRWEDAPRPVCWATMPIGSPLHEPLDRSPTTDVVESAQASVEPRPGRFRRAHPDWVIPRPPPGTPVVLEGMAPEGEPLSFAFPALRVHADFLTGRSSGSRELLPSVLVLLPGERRFYVVYRHAFTVVHRPLAEQAMRLRIEDRGERAA